MDAFYPIIESLRRIDVSSAEGIFSACTLLVLPAWALLVLAPGWRWSASLIGPVIVPAILAGVYAWLLGSHFGRGDGGFGSLAAVQTFFSKPVLLVAGWIHYLAIDLFVGSWEVRDSRRNGIPHLLVLPCLALTLLFGPLGLAAYLFVRAMQTRRIPLEFSDGQSRRRYTGNW